jgi:membrane-associated phospholipid phosphatase
VIALALVLAAQTAQPTPSPAPSQPATLEPGFFDDGMPGYYLQWYGAEYVGVLAVGTLLGTGALNGVQPPATLLGPSISLSKPDVALLMDPRLDDVIGKPMLRDIVPAPALAAGVGVLLLADAGVDLADRQDLHRTHAIILGGAEAVVGAAAITEVLKLGVGELRPDFRERYLRASCSGVVPKVDGVDCKKLLSDGFTVDRNALLDGMKSFPSEHSSTAFAAASFIAMQLGSAYVWNRDTQQWVRPIAVGAIGALLAGATFVAASRVEDDHHHLEDVAVGAAIGTASGVSAYLLHFDLDNNAIHRGVTVAPMPVAGGAGVGVTGPL